MAIPKVLTYQDIKNLLTGADYLDASDAGVIPSNFVTNDNNLIIQQDFNVYFWLRDTKELRSNTLLLKKEGYPLFLTGKSYAPPMVVPLGLEELRGRFLCAFGPFRRA